MTRRKHSSEDDFDKILKELEMEDKAKKETNGKKKGGKGKKDEGKLAAMREIHSKKGF